MMHIRCAEKRHGFTLVELLVVIVIIAVLAGTLVMSVTSMQEEAEFTKMVGDLRSMKAAARLYYAEDNNASRALGIYYIKTNIDKYMDRKITDKDLKHYYTPSGTPLLCVRFYKQTGTTVPKAVIGGIQYDKLPKGLQRRFDSRTKDIGFKNSFGGPWGERTEGQSHSHIYLQLY